MEFKGSEAIEKFSSLLKDESPRCVAIVIAAYFDEKLGEMLNQSNERAFAQRIDDALASGFLTHDEHHDLHSIRQLRNAFAHEIESTRFDAQKAKTVDELRIWQAAVGYVPKYAEIFPMPKEQLLYVAGALFVRLNARTTPGTPPLPEPPFTDILAWPPVTDI